MDRRPLYALAAMALLALAWWAASDSSPVAQAEPEQPAAAEAAPTPAARAPQEVPPAPAGWAEIECPLPVQISRFQQLEVLVEREGEEPVITAADVGSTALRFRGPIPEGVGLVTLPGYEQAGVVWFTDSEGRLDCLFPRDPEALPHGVLRLPAPGDHSAFDSVYYSACGAGLTAAPEGEDWVERELPAGPCEVRGCRQTGIYTRCGTITEVMVLADQVVEFIPPVPSAPVAALGLVWIDLEGAEWYEDTGWIVAVRAEPGAEPESPLRVGDRVLTLNGESTDGLSVDDFAAIVSGSEPVELEAVRGGDSPRRVMLD